MQDMPIYILIGAGVTVVAMLWSFFNGIFTRNYSTVDRLWSVLPGIYVLIGLPWLGGSPRYLVAGLLVIAWCVRLTRNFGIKGGYARKNGRFAVEDYRWEVMRERIPNRVAFEFFNFFFISIYQLTLIFAFTLPLLIVGALNAPIGRFDILLFVAHAILLGLELLADEQQFLYYGKRGTTDDSRVELGFNTFGLWKYSRHPNYVCEMGQWIVVGLYPLAAGLGWHPWGWASVVLVLLFAGSTALAESISSRKYPEYKDWKKATPSWLPFTLVFRLKARQKFFGALADKAADASRNKGRD